MQNKKKVDRYYRKFQEAAQKVEDYINQVGECLEEGEYISEASEFREALEERTDAREAARIQLEQVVREEGVGVGPITVTNKTTVTYDGEYLYNNLDKKIRDKVVEVVYKVKAPAFKKFAASGQLSPEVADEAVVDRKESVALKGVPTKIGLG